MNKFKEGVRCSKLPKGFIPRIGDEIEWGIPENCGRFQITGFDNDGAIQFKTVIERGYRLYGFVNVGTIGNHESLKYFSQFVKSTIIIIK